MKTKIFHFLEQIRTSFWFVPSLMAFLAIVFSYVMVQLDKSEILHVGLLDTMLYSGSAEGSRSVLSTISGSMITVAGVVFSITVVALTLAASQFGSRLLRNFMGDRVNQVVLGAFIATFIYCLLVLQSIHYNGTEIFVPRLATTLGLILALVDFGILIYFFHHVSTLLQAERVIETVSRELSGTINKLFPDEDDENISPQPDKTSRSEINFNENSIPVLSQSDGYLKAVDEEGILKCAVENDLYIKLKHRPGDFVFQNADLMLVRSEQEVDQELKKKLGSFLIKGGNRTPEQDVEFAIHQLVQLALRALSPGINDPHTAMTCIDHLGAAVRLINYKILPGPFRYDGKGKQRLILDNVTYDGILDAAFNQIRQYANGSADISIRLLEVFYSIAESTRDKKRIQAIERHANMVYGAARSSLSENDRMDLKGRYDAFMQAIR